MRSSFFPNQELSLFEISKLSGSQLCSIFLIFFTLASVRLSYVRESNSFNPLNIPYWLLAGRYAAPAISTAFASNYILPSVGRIGSDWGNKALALPKVAGSMEINRDKNLLHLSPSLR